MLLSTALLLHKKPKRWRTVLSAAVGALSSFLIFLDTLPFGLPALIKIILGVTLVLIAFEWQGAGVFLKTAGIFIAVNFIFAGTMMALWFFLTPVDMYYRNGVVYFNISALTLAVSTVIAYFAIRLIGWIFDRRIPRQALKTIVISLNGKEVLLQAFHDTGNKLCDPFTSTPVIICTFNAIKPLLPEYLHPYFSGQSELPELSGDWAKRIRTVPYHVVGKNGLMRCFVPDCFACLEKVEKKEYKVYIGISTEPLSGGEYQALFNANLHE